MNKQQLLDASKPYIAAIVIFLVLAFAYCSPVFEGKTIKQHDVLTAAGMQKEMSDYHEKTGDYTLWTNSMFGGMPTYQIGGAGVPTNNVFSSFVNVLRFGLPKYSVDIIFLYLLGFFVLLISLGINPWMSIVGAIAFAFSSYNIIIIGAGHVNKALVISILPIVLSGILLIYRRKYLWGILLTVFSFGMQLRFNHVQMTYYLGLGLLIFGIVEFIFAIYNKQLKNFFISSLIAIGAVGISVIPNVANLMVTNEYTHDTQRGISELEDDTSKKPSNGLDKEYALRWSYGKAESLTFLIPDFYGGSSSGKLSEKSNVYNALLENGVPRKQATQLIQNVPTYWGDQPGTSGPVYFGAIIVFLFLLGFLLVDLKTKIWISAVFLITLFLSWGRNMMWFTDLFFNYIPLYSKFRAVSSILVIASILFPLLAFLGIKEIQDKKADKKVLLQKVKTAFYIVGGLSAFILLFGPAFFNFSSEYDSQLITGGYPQWFVDALLDDRRRLFRIDAFRSLLFISLAALTLVLFVNEKLKKNYFVLALGLLILVDLWGIDKRYLNNDDFVSKKEAKTYKPNRANLQILEDKDPNFRVFNVTVDPFNESSTSYFHKSIGGYHAAKLQRYQDLITYHIGRQNMEVINMLNTKYFIVPDKENKPMAQYNPGAMGNAWFVKEIKVVENAKEEISALNNFDARTTAILDKRFLGKLVDINSLKADTIKSSTIVLTDYKPNKLTYKATSEKDLLAVFSEIYYNQGKGWNAYLDGQPVEHVRVNYVLRAMAVPQGEHEIVFKFEPSTFYKGLKIAGIGSVIVILVLLGCIAILVQRKLKAPVS